MTRFLLDTGLLLGLARKADWARNAVEPLSAGHRPAAVCTSVICHGEILALAKRNGRGRQRRAELDRILRTLPAIDLHHEQIWRSDFHPISGAMAFSSG